MPTSGAVVDSFRNLSQTTFPRGCAFLRAPLGKHQGRIPFCRSEADMHCDDVLDLRFPDLQSRFCRRDVTVWEACVWKAATFMLQVLTNQHCTLSAV
jgi:hypothetical protein